MTTTDAEAIARIIDPSAFNPDAQTIGKPAYWEAKREWAVRTATAILSYLASRREAQEPVGYTSGGELERLREWSRHADAIGVVGEKTTTRCIPLYTTPPSPAPAGISDDQIIAIWRAAMTASCNMVIGRQNRLNDDDGPCDVLNEQGEIASQIKRILEPDELYIGEIRQTIGAVPAPAGEAVGVRSALEQFEGRIKKYIAQLKATGQADVAHLLRRDVDCLRAALNGGRSDD